MSSIDIHILRLPRWPSDSTIPDPTCSQLPSVNCHQPVAIRELPSASCHQPDMSYMASRTILIVRKETCCRHIGYSYRLTARVLLYAPSHRQDNTYHGLCYTSRGALAGTRNSSMGPPHEGSIRRPIAPWANALPLSYVPLLSPLNLSFTFTEIF